MGHPPPLNILARSTTVISSSRFSCPQIRLSQTRPPGQLPGDVSVNILRRPRIVGVVIVVLILAVGLYLFEGRIPSWQERKKLSQPVVADFNDIELLDALQSLVNQTDGTVTITVCSGLTHSKVSLHSGGSIALARALNEIVAQVPSKYFPYGTLDRAVARPVILCRNHNDTVVTIEKDLTHKLH